MSDQQFLLKKTKYKLGLSAFKHKLTYRTLLTQKVKEVTSRLNFKIRNSKFLSMTEIHQEKSFPQKFQIVYRSHNPTPTPCPQYYFFNQNDSNQPSGYQTHSQSSSKTFLSPRNLSSPNLLSECHKRQNSLFPIQLLSPKHFEQTSEESDKEIKHRKTAEFQQKDEKANLHGFSFDVSRIEIEEPQEKENTTVKKVQAQNEEEVTAQESLTTITHEIITNRKKSLVKDQGSNILQIQYNQKFHEDQILKLKKELLYLTEVIQKKDQMIRNLQKINESYKIQLEQQFRNNSYHELCQQLQQMKESQKRMVEQNKEQEQSIKELTQTILQNVQQLKEEQKTTKQTKQLLQKASLTISKLQQQQISAQSSQNCLQSPKTFNSESSLSNTIRKPQKSQ